MNPEIDATAIWLERKLDIPASGSWLSESIFAIPLSSEVLSGSTVSDSPGVIVFECTPLGDIGDHLEKYVAISRVLVEIPILTNTIFQKVSHLG